MAFIPPFSILDFAGVGVAAVSGVLTAGRRKMDLFGVFVVAIVTAIGGGTMRDLLLDRHPIFWIAHPVYLLVIAIGSVATVLYTRFVLPSEKLLLYADAVALGIFTIAGAEIAEAREVPVTIVIFMATLTGVGGGIARDVLTREFPMVLRQDIYAIAAILGAIIYEACLAAEFTNFTAAIAGMSVVIAIRVAVIRQQVDLPLFTIGPDRAQFRHTREWNNTVDKPQSTNTSDNEP